MGALVEYGNIFIKIKHNKLNGIKVNMPDVAMTLAVVAVFATGTTVIDGIGSWKFKETDRLQVMKNELLKLGVMVSATEDSISITPPNLIDLIKQNIRIDTYDDHRMAMCFSLLAVGGVAVTIKDYNCVKKTFPDYFELFSKVCYSNNS